MGHGFYVTMLNNQRVYLDNTIQKLTGAKRREWMGMGEWGNGMIIDSHYGSFPHSLLSTSKKIWIDKITIELLTTI